MVSIDKNEKYNVATKPSLNKLFPARVLFLIEFWQKATISSYLKRIHCAGAAPARRAFSYFTCSCDCTESYSLNPCKPFGHEDRLDQMRFIFSWMGWGLYIVAFTNGIDTGEPGRWGDLP